MSTNIVTKFDNNIQGVLARFHEILDLITVHDKSLQVHATESLQIQSNAQTIVRLVNELLNLTKTLKEKWILGQVEDKNGQNHDLAINDNYNLYIKINNLLNGIVNNE